MRFFKKRALVALAATGLLVTGGSRLALQAQGSPAPSGKLVLHIGANAVGFGPIRLGQASPPRTITLQNVGNAPMAIVDAIVAGAHASDFSIVSTCAGLPAGGLCTMTFTFTPNAIGPRNAMLHLSASTPTAPYMLPLLGLGTDTNTPQPSAGPVDPRTGFPTYFSDGYNALELCLDHTPPNDAAGNPQPQSIDPLTGLLTPTMCLAPTPDASRPPAVTDEAATTNFGAEAFWWSAEALVTPAGWTRAVLTMAQEAAFTGEAAVVGQQWAFGRLRLRADGVPPGTYRFTHPFGVDVHTVTAADDRIFDTSDIGCFNTPCDFSLALNTRVTRFLQCVNAPIVVNGREYLGDPSVACQVTGSPVNQNLFRIERVEANGSRTLLAQTNLFAVSGKRIAPLAAPPPANQAPDAVDDAASTAFNTPVTITVLGNDTDPNLPDDVLSVTSATQGAGGTTAISAGGAITYTPNGTFSGTDTFQYAIADSSGLGDVATVTVTVAPPANRNPIAVNDSAATNVNTPVTVQVLANDSDPDAGDVLTVTGVTSVVNGTAVRNASNTVTFTPAAAVSGTGSFSYSVADGHGGTASASVLVTIVNRAPIAVADVAATTAGVAVQITNLLANDSDPDGDPLSIAAVVPGAGGTPTLNANNAVTFVPAAGFTGSATFTYSSSDGRGGLTPGGVTVTVSPAVPAPTGPVLALNFNEATGTQVLDRSGLTAPNNGTMNAGVSRVAGRSAAAGSALQFNGTSGMVTVADAASLDLTSAVTLSAWVRATGSNDWRSLILKERGTAAAPGLSYSLYANDATRTRPAGFFFVAGTDRSVAGTAALPLNIWTHLAVTYGGGFMRLYIDGVQVGQVAQAGNLTASNNPLRIGGNALWGEFFAGQLDDVRVYNRVLTVGEIQADMNTPIQ